MNKTIKYSSMKITEKNQLFLFRSRLRKVYNYTDRLNFSLFIDKYIIFGFYYQWKQKRVQLSFKRVQHFVFSKRFLQTFKLCYKSLWSMISIDNGDVTPKFNTSDQSTCLKRSLNGELSSAPYTHLSSLIRISVQNHNTSLLFLFGFVFPKTEQNCFTYL